MNALYNEWFDGDIFPLCYSQQVVTKPEPISQVPRTDSFTLHISSGECSEKSFFCIG